MNIAIHEVQKVLVEKVGKVGDTRSRYRSLRVVTPSGAVEIVLYSDAASKLEIVRVGNLYEYEPEPAA